MENFTRTGYTIEITIEGTQQEFLYSQEEFKNNKLISLMFYEKNGLIIEKTINSYYENGNLKQTEIFTENNELSQKIEYLYQSDDDCEKIIEITHYQDETKDEYIEIFKNNKISRTERLIDGTLDIIEEYFYDDQKLVKYIKLDSNNFEIEKSIHSYIDNNRIIEYYSNGEFLQKITLIYNNDKIMEKHLDNGSFVSKNIYKYDSNGNEIEIVLYKGDTIVGKVQ